MASESVIYLADQRGLTRSSSYESFHTFNFGSYQNEYRKPFMRLTVFNEDTLKPRSILTYSVPENYFVFVLPVIGGIEFKIKEDDSITFIEAGQQLIMDVKDASQLIIVNPYQTGSVSFICCWFASEYARRNTHAISSFDFEGSQNELVRLFSTEVVKAHLGKFSGRQDYILKLDKDHSSIFAFVIEGAFEFQNRLLQPKDGLSIKSVLEVEFEALSNGAIVLIFEL
jgi:hypothetical protein